MRASSPAPRRVLAAAIAACLAVGSLAGSVAAADWTLVVPAGIACAGFDLRIDGVSAQRGPLNREFTDRDGNTVKVLSAGTGDQLTFTNVTTDASLALRSNGYATISRPGSDGLWTVSTMGHTVIILWPTDSPPGPSTTLYVGRVTYTVDAVATFTLLSTSGTTIDICAALG